MIGRGRGLGPGLAPEPRLPTVGRGPGLAPELRPGVWNRPPVQFGPSAPVNNPAPPAPPAYPAPPAPLWYSTSIVYVLDGQYKSYRSGYSSFSSRYDPAKAKRVSLISLGSKEDAQEAFDLLSFCKGEQILPAHFVDHTDVVVGPVDMDLVDYFKARYKDFVDEEKTSWWDFISRPFIVLVGDILKALMHLYSLEDGKSYCGNLKGGAVLKRDGKKCVGAQLAILKKGSAKKAEYRQQCLKDLRDLQDLIVDILLIPFPDVEKTDVALSSHFKDQELPSSLVSFITNLVVDDVCNKWDVIWILDNAFFWTSAEKYSLIRKLLSRGHRLKHFRGLANLNYQMEMTLAVGQQEHWSSLLPPEGPIRDVYKRKVEEYEGHGGFGQNVFLGIAFIFKNVVNHYNDYVRKYNLNVAGDEFIIEKIDNAFDGTCCKIQVALGHYYWKSGVPNTDMTRPEFYLRKQPF